MAGPDRVSGAVAVSRSVRRPDLRRTGSREDRDAYIQRSDVKRAEVRIVLFWAPLCAVRRFMCSVEMTIYTPEGVLQRICYDFWLAMTF